MAKRPRHIDPTIGNRIAQARINAGYATQEEFADAIPVSRGLVGQWESHRKKPGRDILAKIAKLTGHSMEYLNGSNDDARVSLSLDNERDVQLMLRFWRLRPIQQQRFFELIADSVDVAGEQDP